MKIHSAEFVIDNLYMVTFREDQILLSAVDPDDCDSPWELVMSVDNPVCGMAKDDGTFGIMSRKYAPSVETAIEIVRRFGTKREPE